MRLGLTQLLAAALTLHVPAEDQRNVYVPDVNTHFTMPSYSSLESWEARKAKLRRQILTAAGLTPMPEKTPLRSRVFGRLDRGDYQISKVLVETLPGYYLGGNLYEPVNAQGKLPAVLVPHGHWKFGRLQNDVEYSVPALAVNLARQGYVVFTYDMVGYNDTRQTGHSFGGDVENLWSFNPLGLQLWNGLRSIDFLQSLPNVDTRRLAVTGASGGGTQTFLLSAVDDRITVSAPVNMISASMQGGDPCEEAPGLRLDTFNAEIAALMAPRPMLVVSCTRDWTKNTPKEEYPEIQSIYRLYGETSKVGMVQFDAPHNYNQASREAVYRFFAAHLLPGVDADTLKDREFQQERDEDLLALRPNAPLGNGLNYDQLFEEWKRSSQKQAALTDDPSVLRERLAATFAAEWPTSVYTQTKGTQILLSRQGRSDLVKGLWVEGAGTDVAVVVHPRSAELARRTALVQKLIDSGYSVLMIDPFQSEAGRALRMRSQRYFLSYNQGDEANRVQDILTALSYLRSTRQSRIHLIGIGAAGVRCLFAAAIAPVDLDLAVDLGDFRGTDEDFRKRFFVSGIQRAGGLPVALKLTEDSRKDCCSFPRQLLSGSAKVHPSD